MNEAIAAANLTTLFYDPDTEPIRSFTGRWLFLSNFFTPAVLVFEGIEYQNSEAAFNAGKTVDPLVRRWVAAATTPAEAKTRGNNRTVVILRPDWDNRVRYEVMNDVLHAKFLTHPVRTQALLSTGNALLVEGNRHHDNVWGDCTCARPTCIAPGQNNLGRLLMALRAEVRATT